MSKERSKKRKQEDNASPDADDAVAQRLAAYGAHGRAPHAGSKVVTTARTTPPPVLNLTARSPPAGERFMQMFEDAGDAAAAAGDGSSGGDEEEESSASDEDGASGSSDEEEDAGGAAAPEFVFDGRRLTASGGKGGPGPRRSLPLAARSPSAPRLDRRFMSSKAAVVSPGNRFPQPESTGRRRKSAKGSGAAAPTSAAAAAAAAAAAGDGSVSKAEFQQMQREVLQYGEAGQGGQLAPLMNGQRPWILSTMHERGS